MKDHSPLALVKPAARVGGGKNRVRWPWEWRHSSTQATKFNKVSEMMNATSENTDERIIGYLAVPGFHERLKLYVRSKLTDAGIFWIAYLVSMTVAAMAITSYFS